MDNYFKYHSIKWNDNPEAHDYPAAEEYLSLIYGRETARTIVSKFFLSELTEYKAKDLLRAAQVKPLNHENYHVKRDIAKISDGKELSPLLIVIDTEVKKAIIADGYHRLCAVYLLNEDAVVKLKAVEID